MIRFIVALLIATSLLVGCGGSLNNAFNQALAIEQATQTWLSIIDSFALDAISMLPADQQRAKQIELLNVYTKANDALQVLEDATTALANGTAQTVDFAALELQLVKTCEDLVAFVESLKVEQAKLAEPKARLATMKARMGAK